jgi:hypothetical protein
VTIQIKDLTGVLEIEMTAVRGGFPRTNGTDEVGVLTENRQPNNPPPSGQIFGSIFGSIAPV